MGHHVNHDAFDIGPVPVFGIKLGQRIHCFQLGELLGIYEPVRWLELDRLTAEQRETARVMSERPEVGDRGRGRRREGIQDDRAIAAMLASHLGGRTLEELTPALKRGNSSPEYKERRLLLAGAVANVFPLVNSASLANVLDCSLSTVYKLRKAA